MFKAYILDIDNYGSLTKYCLSGSLEKCLDLLHKAESLGLPAYIANKYGKMILSVNLNLVPKSKCTRTMYGVIATQFLRKLEVKPRRAVRRMTMRQITALAKAVKKEIKHAQVRLHKMVNEDVFGTGNRAGNRVCITEYCVATQKCTTISLGNSELMEKLEAMGHAADGIIKVSSALEMELSDVDRASAQARLDHIIAAGLTLNGMRYVPLLAGSSDIRKGSSVWIREDLYEEIGRWLLCGLKTSKMKMAVNKLLAYMGLSMSSTRSFKQVFECEIDVRRVCVVPDTYVEVTGVADFVDGENVIRVDEHTVRINAFDGAALIRPELTGGKCCTLRAPWSKLLAVPGDIWTFARERGASLVVRDYWGNEVNLENIDLIMTESCFKAAAQYESFQQYQEAFEADKREFRVCVEEHAPRPKDMPYQQLQTLVGGTWEDAMKLACMTREVMHSYKDADEAAALVGGNMAKSIRLYHELLADPYTAAMVKEAYDSKFRKALGGKVLGIGYNAFIAPDVIAFMEAILGLPVKGVLKAGEVHCKPAGFGLVDVTRSPHLDHAHCLMINVRKPNDYFMGPTMYFNIWDFATIRLRADYDGDHVWYSRNSFLLEAVRKTDKFLGNLPVDWIAPKAAKDPITKKSMTRFFASLTQTSQIGIYADNFTRFWAWLTTELDKGTVTMEEAREVWCWLNYAGNVLIDAAKHGSANVRPPKRVQEFSHMPLPAFCEYAKASEARPVGCEHWASRCAMTEGFGDMYHRAVRDNVDAELHIEGSEEFIFDPTVLMHNPDNTKPGQALAGLCARGRWNRELQKAEGEGLFQKLAFATARELEALDKGSSSKQARSSWEAERGHIAFEQIRAWVEARGETIEHAYDVIVASVFCGNRSASEAYQYTMKRAFWSFFGHMVVDLLRSRQEVFDGELTLPEEFDEDDEFAEE